VRRDWNRSAAKTPSWQVIELLTRITVLTSENVTLSCDCSNAKSSGSTARCVKYIAKRPAKNMSSLDSQTMVPTETALGRLTLRCGALTAGADDTASLLPVGGRSGPPLSGRASDEGPDPAVTAATATGQPGAERAARLACSSVVQTGRDHP